MSTELKIFTCTHCGNMAELILDAGVSMVCCGEEMQRLLPGTTDAAQEKHVPVCEVKDGKITVKVGSVAHPMQEDHYIPYVWLHSKCAVQRACLNPGDEPCAVFTLVPGDEPIAAYEWCNKHGLWKTEAK